MCIRDREDHGSKARLETLETELEVKQQELNNLKNQWQEEKSSVGRLQQIRQQIEDLKYQIEKAEREYDLNRVAELRYGILPRLEKELKAEEEHLDQKKGEACLLKEEVDEEDEEVEENEEPGEDEKTDRDGLHARLCE